MNGELTDEARGSGGAGIQHSLERLACQINAVLQVPDLEAADAAEEHLRDLQIQLRSVSRLVDIHLPPMQAARIVRPREIGPHQG